MCFRLVLLLPTVFLPAATYSPAAGAAEAKADLLGEFQNWFAYSTGTGANKVCYVLAKPRVSEPRGARRDPVFFMISNWPAKKIQGEPSFVPGYAYKDKATADVQIGREKFSLFTENTANKGGAWVQRPQDEKRLMETMKMGANMVVAGTSSRGTATKDTFSLSGITAALQAIDKACR